MMIEAFYQVFIDPTVQVMLACFFSFVLYQYIQEKNDDDKL